MAANLPERALREFERALEVAPDDATALNNYGVALSRLGRTDAAIEQLRHALRVDPCSTTTLKNLASLQVTDVIPCQ
jgi:Flp pilus assembly protein TadD